MKTLLVASPFANLGSISRALVHAGAEIELTDDTEKIAAAGKIVLPGVGSFAVAMHWLESTGVAAALRQAVSRGSRLLGICLGFQLLFESSEEGTRQNEVCRRTGLRFVEGHVSRFSTSLPVPAIGWNGVTSNGSQLFRGIESGSEFYFVHSYRAIATVATTATADYGEAFTAAVEQENVCGVQFHPEKSSAAGLRLLRNFVEMR